jgi:hypothetical protein
VRRIALVLACPAVVAAFALAAPPAPPAEAAASPCSGGRFTPGTGRLEWKRSARRILAVRGLPGRPIARTGSTVILSGVTAIGGARRHGFAAIDLRTGRPTPFDPSVPTGQSLTAMTASPTAMYLAYESFDEAPVGPKQIRAYSLRTGALLPGFDPPDFRDGTLGGMVYVNGRVVMGGAPPVGAGITLGAYDATTGAPVWRAPIDWPVLSLATDGSRVFAEVPPEVGDRHIVTAFDATDGSPVADWGSTLPARDYRTELAGADAARVYSVAGWRVQDVRPFVVSTGDGRPVSLPRLPSNATGLRPGAGGTILGQLRVPTHNGPRIQIDAVFETTGKLIGTVPSPCSVLAQRDARHLLVSHNVDQSHSQILELVRPRR